MKKILQWPEVLLPLLLWLTVMVLVLIRNYARIDELAMSASTVVYVSICYLCYAVPALLLGRPLPLGDGEKNNDAESLDHLAQQCRRQVWLQLLFGLAFVLACAAYLYARRSVLGMDTFEARLERGAAESTDSRIMPLYALLSLFGVAGLCRLMAAKWPWWFLLFYAGGALGLGTLVYMLLGTRYEVLLPVIMLLFSGYVLFYGRVIHRHRIAFRLITVVIVTGVLGLNSLLSLSGFRLGSQNADANQFIETGDRFTFGVLGNSELAIPIKLSVGLFDQYALQPVLFLDYYLKHNDVRPVYGAHQFSYVARRLGAAESGEVAKTRVDQMYEFLGVPEGVNVWATLMREVAIDAGISGGPFVFLAFGCLLGLAKRYMFLSLGAQFLVCYLTAIMLFSPFSSLFKSNLMQAGFYGAGLWFAWDYFRLKKIYGR